MLASSTATSSQRVVQPLAGSEISFVASQDLAEKPLPVSKMKIGLRIRGSHPGTKKQQANTKCMKMLDHATKKQEAVADETRKRLKRLAPATKKQEATSKRLKRLGPATKKQEATSKRLKRLDPATKKQEARKRSLKHNKLKDVEHQRKREKLRPRRTRQE